MAMIVVKHHVNPHNFGVDGHLDKESAHDVERPFMEPVV